MSSYVSVKNVTKSIRKRRILDDISVEIPKGIVAGFTGNNGSGKSMLFRSIAGLIKIDSGSITIDGTTLDRRKPYPVNMGILLDASGFWDDLSGLKNLKMLASLRKLIGEEEIVEALKTVGLDPSDKRPTSAYSSGMRQRLAIAQAIMEHPDLVILDEPTNTLDKDGIHLINDILEVLISRGTTVLLACHNQPQLEELFDLHVHLYDGRVSEMVGES